MQIAVCLRTWSTSSPHAITATRLPLYNLHAPHILCNLFNFGFSFYYSHCTYSLTHTSIQSIQSRERAHIHDGHWERACRTYFIRLAGTLCGALPLKIHSKSTLYEMAWCHGNFIFNNNHDNKICQYTVNDGANRRVYFIFDSESLHSSPNGVCINIVTSAVVEVHGCNDTYWQLPHFVGHHRRTHIVTYRYTQALSACRNSFIQIFVFVHSARSVSSSIICIVLLLISLAGK